MTYGEEVYLKRSREEYSNGGHIYCDSKPMEREEAIRYYNNKLLPYWLNNMGDNIAPKNRRKALNLLLGNGAVYMPKDKRCK